MTIGQDTGKLVEYLQQCDPESFGHKALEVIERLKAELAEKTEYIDRCIAVDSDALERAEKAEDKAIELEFQLRDMHRFWSKVKMGQGCWLWMGARGRPEWPYGHFTVRSRMVPAHRWLYQRLFGPIQEHIEICHTCDNPACVRPDHLFTGTKSDNMQDSANKGRNAMQRHPEHSYLKSPKAHLNQPRGETQGNSQLKTSDIHAIRQLSKAGSTSSAIAKQFGVSDGHIRKIVTGKAWSHV